MKVGLRSSVGKLPASDGGVPSAGGGTGGVLGSEGEGARRADLGTAHTTQPARQQPHTQAMTDTASTVSGPMLVQLQPRHKRVAHSHAHAQHAVCKALKSLRLLLLQLQVGWTSAGRALLQPTVKPGTWHAVANARACQQLHDIRPG